MLLLVRRSPFVSVFSAVPFCDSRQLDLVHADIDDARILASLLYVADADDFGRRPGVNARRSAQQPQLETKPFKVARQLAVGQLDLEAQVF
jgi:hypothetical protein